MFSKKVVLPVLVVALGYVWLNYIKRGPVYKSDKSLDGKTVFITGGNTGVGKLTAIEMAQKGARVIIASRNLAKSNFAKEDIIKESGNQNIRTIRLDLADFDSVRSVVKELQESEKYLDYVINNAGAMDIPGTISSGINKLFAVNHFGHFLLTNLLLDKLKAQSKTRPVRILNLSSEAYKYGKITEEGFRSNSTSTFEMFYVYGHTKLANIYFTSELKERLSGYDITVYSVHPGVIKTELGSNYPYFFKMIIDWIIAPVFQRDPYYGTQTTLYCALDDEVVKYNGGYFVNCKHNTLWSHATNKTIQKYLWDESVKVTNLS